MERGSSLAIKIKPKGVSELKKYLGLLLAVALLLAMMIPAVSGADYKEFHSLNLGGIVGKAIEEIPKEQARQDKLDPDKKDAIGRMPLETEIAIEKFLNKDGYTFVTDDWGWAEPLVQKQVAAFVAKDSEVNIFVGETQQPGFAMKGYYEPFPAALAAKIRKNVVPAAWKPMEYKGKIYGVAGLPGVNAFYWNKDLFKKAGLDPEKPPKTWNQILEYAEKIDKAGNGQFYGGGVYMGPNYGGSLRYTPFVLMLGGGYVDSKGYPTLDKAANVTAFEYLRKLSKHLPPGIAAAPSEGAFWDAMNQQRFAMLIDGPWRVAEGARAGLDFGVSTIPLPDKGGKAANVTIGASFAAVPKYAKYKDEAFKLIEFITMDKGFQTLQASTGQRPSVLASVSEDPAYLAKYPFMKAIFDAEKGNVQGLPTFAKNDVKVWDVLNRAVSKIVITNQPVKDILKQAQKEAMALMK